MFYRFSWIILIVTLCFTVVAFILSSTGHVASVGWIFPVVGGLLIGCSLPLVRRAFTNGVALSDLLRPPTIHGTVGTVVGLLLIAGGYQFL
jgi:hypothetical protein